MLTAEDLRASHLKNYRSRLEAIDRLLEIANAKGQNSVQYELANTRANEVCELVNSLSSRGFIVKHEQGSTYRDSWNYLRIFW